MDLKVMTFYSIALLDNYSVLFSATLEQLQPQFTSF